MILLLAETAVVGQRLPHLAALDLWIIGIYLLLLLVLGGVLAKKTESSGEMFAAGGRSPWWLSGISAYMTMFSSGTFVVWGGIAYTGGLVAVSICMTLGVSAMLVGFLFARRWKATGARSAAEFIDARFSHAAVQVYTWLGLIVRMLGAAVALYSIAVMICALIPIPAVSGAWGWLRDAGTGNFSLTVAILLIGVVVVAISSNLWAVLVTDTLQFFVLSAAVVVVIPLLMGHEAIGGVGSFVRALGETPVVYRAGNTMAIDAGHNMLSPASGNFTWLFLAGWMLIHMFKIGGEWAFVQRFLCVPTKRDAWRVGAIFGVLYLVTPLIWMIPPMAYRIMAPIPPNADTAQVMRLAEQAYILACEAVLPAGLIGLMIAAMFSATVSMVDSEINVYAGALTRDIYGRLTGNLDNEKRLVTVGRVFTLALGAVVTGLAIAIPRMGGAQNVILSITGLFVGPMVLPTLWALYSRKIGFEAVVLTACIGAAASAVLKFGLGDVSFIQQHSREAEVVVGIVPPVLTLAAIELLRRRVHPGWTRATALGQGA